MRAVVALLFLLFTAPLAAAQRPDGLAAGVTEELIAVSSSFRGARVTIFGVAPQRRQGDLVVVLRGPPTPVTVTRKRQAFGLWVDADPVLFRDAPGFFAAMSARPLAEIVPPRAFWELSLDPAVGPQVFGLTPQDADRAAYRAALVRLKRARGLYLENPRALDVGESGLFKTQIALPANAPPGLYRVDVYLFRNKRLLATESASVVVSRVGIERTVYDLAMRHPLFYGLFVAALALAAGWVAAVMFRRA